MGRRRSASPSEYRLKTPPRTTLSYEEIEGPPRRGQSPPAVTIRGNNQRLQPTASASRIELFPEKLGKASQPVIIKKTFEERLSFNNPNSVGESVVDNMPVEEDVGFSIRGSSASQGFSIRGSAGNKVVVDDDVMNVSPNAGVELLPSRGNAGVELLPGRGSNGLFSRIGDGEHNRSRGNRRRKAQDMFG